MVHSIFQAYISLLLNISTVKKLQQPRQAFIKYLQLSQLWHQVYLDQRFFDQCSRCKVLTIQIQKYEINNDIDSKFSQMINCLLTVWILNYESYSLYSSVTKLVEKWVLNAQIKWLQSILRLSGRTANSDGG